MDAFGNLFGGGGSFAWDSMWSNGSVGPEPKTATAEEAATQQPTFDGNAYPFNHDNPALHSTVTGFGDEERNSRGSRQTSSDHDDARSQNSRHSRHSKASFAMNPSKKFEFERVESLNSQLAAMETYADAEEDGVIQTPQANVSKVMATKEEMQRLKDLRAENEKLRALRDKYQIRVADAQKNHMDARSKVKKVPPAILRKGQLWTCEGVVDEAVEIDMSDRKRSQEGELRISKCYTTGMFWSRTASVRVVGRAKNAVIEDCHKLLLTIDGIENSLTIRRCSNLTLALASEMPSINMIRTKDSDLILCYSPNNSRTVQTCMCTAINMNLLEDQRTLFQSVEVLNAWPRARKLQLPDLVQVVCKGQTLQCSAQTSNMDSPETLTLSLDCIEDFQPVRARLHDADTEQVERNLCLPVEQARPRQVVHMGEVGTLKHISAAFLKNDPFFHTRKNLLHSA